MGFRYHSHHGHHAHPHGLIPTRSTLRRDRLLDTLLIAAAITAAALALTSCHDHLTGPCCGGSLEASDSFRFEFPVGDMWSVYLEGFNGDVSVVGDPGASTVIVRGTRVVQSNGPSDAHLRLDDIQIDIYEEDQELVVRTLQPAEDRTYAYVVNYQIIVPDWFVARVYNVNGLVQIENMSSGSAIVNTNGPVNLYGQLGSAFVDNINGDIVAEVAIYEGGFIDLRTVNGSIFLDIPIETSALLEASTEASTTNGQIDVQNLLIRDREDGNGYITGRLGLGDGEILLVTTNGSIRLRGY
jgi:hypothetical protein